MPAAAVNWERRSGFNAGGELTHASMCKPWHTAQLANRLTRLAGGAELKAAGDQLPLERLSLRLPLAAAA